MFHLELHFYINYCDFALHLTFVALQVLSSLFVNFPLRYLKLCYMKFVLLPLVQFVKVTLRDT